MGRLQMTWLQVVKCAVYEKRLDTDFSQRPLALKATISKPRVSRANMENKRYD